MEGEKEEGERKQETCFRITLEAILSVNHAASASLCHSCVILVSFLCQLIAWSRA